MPMVIDQPGISRSDPTVRCLGGGGRPGIVEIFPEDAWRSIEHLSRLVDLDFDPWKRAPHRVGINLAVRLVRDIDRTFGLSVELLEMESQRALEAVDLRPEWLSGGVADPKARKSVSALERSIDEKAAQPIPKAVHDRYRASIENCFPTALRDTKEMVEHH